MSEPKNTLGTTAQHAGRVGTMQAMKDAMARTTHTRGKEREERLTYRTAFLATLGALLLMSLLCYWINTSGIREHVAVVYVDYNLNEKFLDMAPTQPVNPGDNAVKHVIGQWIENVRWMSSDLFEFERAWGKVEQFSTPATLRQLEHFRAEQKERQKAGRRVQVFLKQIQRVPKEAHSWTVSWQEEAVDLMGNLLKDESGIYTTTLGIADFQSKTAKELLDFRRQKKQWRNLFGVFIHGVTTWQRQPLPPRAERKESS